MTRQPLLAAFQQLVDLVVSHPVVLLVVEHGEYHIQVRQQIAQAGRRRDAQREVRALAPFGEARIEQQTPRVDGVAERLEQPRQEPLAAAAGDGRQRGRERDGRVGELLPSLALAA